MLACIRIFSSHAQKYHVELKHCGVQAHLMTVWYLQHVSSITDETQDYPEQNFTLQVPDSANRFGIYSKPQGLSQAWLAAKHRFSARINAEVFLRSFVPHFSSTGVAMEGYQTRLTINIHHDVKNIISWNSDMTKHYYEADKLFMFHANCMPVHISLSAYRKYLSVNLIIHSFGRSLLTEMDGLKHLSYTLEYCPGPTRLYTACLIRSPSNVTTSFFIMRFIEVLQAEVVFS